MSVSRSLLTRPRLLSISPRFLRHEYSRHVTTTATSRFSQTHIHPNQPLPSSDAETATKVYISFGSNIGDRVSNITTALSHLNRLGTVTSTSFLYESAPMYRTDQPKFLNGVAQLSLPQSTTPISLLSSLKSIERELGRDTVVSALTRNNPRTIDLDIILYGDVILSDDKTYPDLPIHIPHPRVTERPFVLQPLMDIDPTLQIPIESESGSHPQQQKFVSVAYALQQCKRKNPSGNDDELVRVTPVPHGMNLLKFDRKRTMLMGVLNVTPDSFSDGGKFNTVENALRQTERFVEHGFHIIDIGGQSTRPGADFISADEERTRVLPVIEAISREFPGMYLSIDTFDASVASSALSCGAHIVNDVSALEQGRNTSMAELLHTWNAPVIMMHMRGTPRTMTQPEHTTYKNTDEVAEELKQSIQQMTPKLQRWNVLVDPGIGFAKTRQHSVHCMQTIAKFVRHTGGYPCVLGLSRKSWMKSFMTEHEWTDVEHRDWGTAGAVATALTIARGTVDIVRVHEPKVGYAVRASDAILRQGMF